MMPLLNRLPTHTTDQQPILYLTFDDGPSPYTPLILDILAQHNAQALFFVLGEAVRLFPDTLRATLAAGHHVGNHTYSHINLSGIDYTTFAQEMDTTKVALFDVASDLIGAETELRYMRPPYGGIDEHTAVYAAQLGYEMLLWDIDSKDWSDPGKEQIITVVQDNVQPGAIILLHDGGGDRSQTVEALEHILSHFTAQGYVFHSIQRMG